MCKETHYGSKLGSSTHTNLAEIKVVPLKKPRRGERGPVHNKLDTVLKRFDLLKDFSCGIELYWMGKTLRETLK